MGNMTKKEEIKTVPFIGTRNIKQCNEHWLYCKNKQIPYIKIYRSRFYSMINWDLWTIDVAGLGLNDSAVKELDQYVQSLLDRRDCIECTMHASQCGYLKVKKVLEEEVLRIVWAIVGNRNNLGVRP